MILPFGFKRQYRLTVFTDFTHKAYIIGLPIFPLTNKTNSFCPDVMDSFFFQNYVR